MPAMPQPLANRRTDLIVAPADLRLVVDGAAFSFETTADLVAPASMVGQERAIEALELGLALRGTGSHVFAAGHPGTGRTSAIAAILDRIAPALPVPPDRVYVHRFTDPEKPRLLTLGPGHGAVLRRETDELRRNLAARIPLLLDERELGRRREALGKRYAAEEEAEVTALRTRAEGDGFALVQLDIGGMARPEIVAVKDGQPVPPATLDDAVRAKLDAYNEELRELARTSRERQRKFAGELRGLVAEAAGVLADEEVGDVRRNVDDESAATFLDEVRDDIVAAVVDLAESGPEALVRLGARLERYRVNLLADRSGQSGAPVVHERFPSRQNLAGSVERVQEGPMSFRADATTIRGGSLLAADGGFLVVHALDLLQEPGAWEALKRTLETGLLEVGASLPGIFGLPRPLEPDPIPLDVKAVVVGEREHFDVLWNVDPDFRKLFGIRADFAADMAYGPAALERYACVVSGLTASEGHPPVEAGAVGALVEDGITRAGRRNRVSVRFGDTAALLREAAHRTQTRGGDRVSRDDVEGALAARLRREGLIEERMQAMLEEGIVLVSTAGTAVGRVNGLSVYHLGYHAFGKPTRITASAAPGQAGIINVEREARMSGNIYDKGVLIIAGFLRRRYADIGPMTLTASLAFEQSYAGVDGDSASIAEVVALLSELSGLPADGGLAITGSINQHGDVQPVGGVDYKIAGFHALCAARGLDGGQGIVMPHQNVLDLMLDPAVVADVAAGRFSVHAVEHVTDALEIALDTPMDEIDRLVRERLETFSAALQDTPGDRPPSGATVQPPSTPIPDAQTP
jgi:predicted ATP-dependent protease